MMVACGRSGWSGPPLQLTSQSRPPRFVGGRVRDDVASVRLHFADASSETLRPVRGYVLYAAPADRLSAERGVVAAQGLDAEGRVVGEMSFRPPRR